MHGAKSESLSDYLSISVSFQRIDFQNDWKIITVFIGGNDLCAHCSDSVR